MKMSTFLSHDQIKKYVICLRINLITKLIDIQVAVHLRAE